MRSTHRFILLLLGFALHALGATPSPSLTAALFDIVPATPALKDRAAQLSPLLLAELSNQPNLLLVERAQLDSTIGELSLGASGLADPATAAKVGRLTGAKALITASAIGSVSATTIVAKIIGTETGRVFAVAEVAHPGEEVATARKLAERLAQNANIHYSDLVAPVEDSHLREARLRAAVSGKKLPTVTISISEQHLTRPVRDPAAETEISNVLGTLGFPLLEAVAAEKAKYRISGEAVSELGLRRGDFVSCRARVEVKVVEVATGKIILQDRQTEVAADIAESTAAKTALQHAGNALAERIVLAIADALH